MRRATVVLFGVFFALVNGSWAAFSAKAAHFVFRPRQNSPRQASPPTKIPGTVWFRDERDRGLLVRAWVNCRGPFNVAIDTGAGFTIVSERLAQEVGLPITRGKETVLAGLSGREVTARHTIIDTIALGDQTNVLPARLQAAVATTLPNNIDAVLDPSEAYAPLGYTLDLPRHQISAFDSRNDGLSRSNQPSDGAVVPWLRDGHTSRPFVRLGDGQLALIDTGSNLGLAISATLVGNPSRDRASRDLGGGTFRSTRVAPSTVTIGSLVLNGVPTDILSGVEHGAPVILGRDALYPFKITFDPIRRLIQIVPSMQDKN